MDFISYLAVNKVAVDNAATDKRALRALQRIQHLETENHELRIRIGVLLRMLIERGVFSAEEYDTAVKSTQAQLEGKARIHRPPAKRKPSAAKPPASRRK